MKTFISDFNQNITTENMKILGVEKFDPMEFSNDYFKANTAAEVSIDPNANVSGISPNNYTSEMGKNMAKKYFYKRLFDEGQKLFGNNFSLRHVYDGSIYIHDATKLQPYCWGTSATEIATLGFNNPTVGTVKPKRLQSFMGQMTEYMMDLSQQFAGAVAVTDLVPWMAWYVEKGKSKRMLDVTWIEDGDMHEDDVSGYLYDDYLTALKKGNLSYSDKEIENMFQSFVHVLNNNFRVGGDSPFTNISINSKHVYYDIFEHYTFPDGKTIDDLWNTIKRVQKIIIDFMSKGQPNGLPYKFPILTANFKADEKELESEWFRYVAEHNANGFMNINFAERFAMCCRLSLEFDFKQNSFGGGGVKVGSMRVANINLPRIAHETNEYMSRHMRPFNETLDDIKADPCDTRSVEEIYLDSLGYVIDRAIEYLTAYKEVFSGLIDSGYLKYFKEPTQWFDMNMFFATVGFCGIWNAAEIILPNEDSLDERVEFMEDIIKVFIDKTKGKSNGIKFNVEEVPSESAAGRMAKFNRGLGERKEYYSNQFVPLQYDISLHERIEIEAKLQSALTGGGMTFLNFDSQITPEQSYEIHRHMLKSGFTGQFCINYGYSKCPLCNTMKIGKHDRVCGCDIKPDFYTRVVGYLAKVKDSATSKQIEIAERKSYLEPRVAL